MIFSLFGTSMLPFKRLAAELDRLAGSRQLEILVQNGHTHYDFKNCCAIPFMSHEEVLEKIRKSDFVICQAGAGSMADGIECGKTVIAVPRRLEFGETAAEQDSLADALAELGCIMLAPNPEDIEEKIEHARTFLPKRPPKNNIPSIVAKFLSEI